MKRGFYALFIVLLTSLGAFSQEGFQVNGRLVDTLGNPISRATIGVYIAGGKDTIKTLTNNVGFFLIKGIPERKFVLMIS
ncbi:MAG: carboxypeptidase regulatory-like domain-containing protein, partial [Chitinophagia bacterium]|nr:carboxypeptidase regulatory-like domain-containing protein [Chitinophagia bacterium]